MTEAVAVSPVSPEANAIFVPFDDVVCCVQAERAHILQPASARVRSADELTPYSCGSAGGEGWWRPYRAQTSGGEVLWLAPTDEEPELPRARITFRVPEAGEYYLFLKGDSWCCPGGLKFRIDGGPKHAPSGEYGIGEWRWLPLKVRAVRVDERSGFTLPEPFNLDAGKHSLDVVGAHGCRGFFIDELVVTRGARLDFTASDSSAEAMLRFAASRGSVGAARILIEWGAGIDARDDGGNTPLVLAESGGHKEVGRLLLERGAATDCPLHDAGFAGDVTRLEALLDENPAGVNMPWKRRYGEAPLHLAAKHGNPEAAKLLLARGAEVDAKTRLNGWTSLHLAAEAGHREVADLLIANGADVDAQDGRGGTPLHKAKDRRTAGLLLGSGADPTVRDSLGRTPLHDAAQEGRAEVVRLLMARGADPNAQDERKDTPLHRAVQAFRGLGAIEALLTGGADVNIGGEHEMTPLHKADTKEAELLIRAGANLNAVDEFGKTPLYCAAWQGNAELAKLLIQNGADVDGGPGDAGVPLAAAAVSGSVAVARLLIDAGAEVNRRDDGGNTPLYWASWHRCRGVIELLLEKGADASIPCRDGRTPQEILDQGRPSNAELFRRAVDGQ